MAKTKVPAQVFQLKITLNDIKPPVWRRVQVKDCTLAKLHQVIQVGMGWTNSHLHSFSIGDRTFGMAEVDDFEELDMLDERKQTLAATLGESIREFIYEYDFGDSWRCRIAAKPLARVH